jgi:signal peptidase II
MPKADMTETKMEESSTQLDLEGASLRHTSLVLPDVKAHLIFWPLLLVGLLLDLWSKKVIFEWLGQLESRSVSIINGFLRFVIAVNDGAAFGIFSGKPYQLAAVSAIALIIIFAVFLFGRIHHKLIHVALALFAAGVCGNLYDRIFNNGSVRDFIDVHIQISGREYRWPTFNIADSLLCIGVGLLIISTLFTGKSSGKRAQQRK